MRGRRPLILVALAAGLLLVLELRHLAALGVYSGTARPGVCRVVTERRLVALTFDDGPSEAYTEQVVRLLEADGAAVTFFMVGRNAAAAPEIVRREKTAGMELGNHTWSHARLPGLRIEQVRDQVLRTQGALDSQNISAALFRAPFGLATPEQFSFVRSLGLRPVHWSIALDHYVGGMGLGPAEAVSEFLRDLRPGAIILAHDGGGDRAEAMAALELLLPELQRRGWEVTTVGHLLSQGKPIFAAPRHWFWQTGFYCP